MYWFTRIFRRSRKTDELAREVQTHLDDGAETHTRSGMSRDATQRANSVAVNRPPLNERRSQRFLDGPRIGGIWADVRHGLRKLVKSPGISFVAISTLAFGLGASTAIFTLTWNIVLKSLPVPHPGQLVEYQMSNGANTLGLSGPLYRLLRERQRSCTDLLAWTDDKNVAVRKGAHTSLQTVEALTGNSFSVLELQPSLGYGFHSGLDRSDAVPAVLSYDYSQAEFGGSAQALGQTLVVADHPVVVVGVMPPAFVGLTANLPPAIYLPFSFTSVLRGKNFAVMPGNLQMSVLGRLRTGMTLTGALAEAHALEPTLRKDADPSGVYLGQFFKNFRLGVQPGSSGNSWMRATYEKPLLVLELLVALLLLLCVVNTALVMLARVSGRQHEYALNLALGAPRIRIVQQVLVETFLLALPGLALGILLGWAGAHALLAMLGSDGAQAADSQTMNIGPNWIILTFNTALMLLIALGAGLLPALRAAGGSPSLDLKAVDRSVAARQQGGWAIALQVAVSVCMVSAAFLLGSALTRLLTAHSGFVFKGAATATIDLSPLQLKTGEGTSIFGRFSDAVKAQPSVTAVGFAGVLPLSNHYVVSRAFSVAAHHVVHSDSSMFSASVSAQYFSAAGTSVIAGRPVLSDVPPGKGAGTCALSESLARTFFPNENPLNQFVYYSTFGRPDGTVLDPRAACRVVAVVENAKYVSLRQPAPAILYQFFDIAVPSDYGGGTETEVIVRAATDSLALAALNAALAQTVPKAAILRSETFSERANADLSRERILVSLSGSFALLALLLTGLGLYGQLMRTVALRMREIGIRLALGASRRFILVSLGRRVLSSALLGLVTGSALAIGFNHTLSKLFDLNSGGALAGCGAATLLVCCVISVAMVLPARRASSVDPIKALRAE